MSGLEVAPLSSALTLGLSSYSPTKNPRNIFRVEVGYDPSDNRLRGVSQRGPVGMHEAH